MLHVALLQLRAGKTQAENLQKGMAYCRQAKQMGADIALFPEMWNTGYTFPDNAGALKEGTVSPDGGFVHAFQDLAKELDMAVAITYLEAYDPQPRNTVTIFDRSGNSVLTYAKVHTCDFDVERYLTPGDDFFVAELDTAGGTVRIGAMICYDREFPESADSGRVEDRGAVYQKGLSAIGDKAAILRPCSIYGPWLAFACLMWYTKDLEG